MTNKAVAIMTKIENEGKRQEKAHGIRWDNRSLVYRKANEAFEASDVAALRAIWIKYFC